MVVSNVLINIFAAASDRIELGYKVLTQAQIDKIENDGCNDANSYQQSQNGGNPER